MKRRGSLKRNTAKAKQWLRRSALSEAIQKFNRRKPLKKRGRKWAEQREENFGAKADMIRQQPCDTCGAAGPSDPSHYPSVGAGGKSRNLFPQCRQCHQDMHQYGVDSFLGWRLKSKAWLVKRTTYWEDKWREAA